jgi:hypothetical protein
VVAVLLQTFTCSELDAMEHEIRMLRDSIRQMEIADEQAAGHVDE